jgi:hypothetical protein
MGSVRTAESASAIYCNETTSRRVYTWIPVHRSARESIHPKEKRVLPNDGTPVAILRHATHPAMGETDVERGRKPTPSTKIRLARFAKIAARSECLVEVQCDAPGLRFLQASLRHSSTGVYMANGLAEILQNRIFQVRVVNASLTDRLLHKGMILGYAMPHPTGIVSVVKKEAEPLANNVPMGLQVSLSPEKCAMGMDPPPLPDRPDVEGALWKQDVDLPHLTTRNAKKRLQCLGSSVLFGTGGWARSTPLRNASN